MNKTTYCEEYMLIKSIFWNEIRGTYCLNNEFEMLIVLI